MKTSPLVRAVVRVERIKRSAPAGSVLWRRAVNLRTKLLGRMTAAEEHCAGLLVEVDRLRERTRAAFRRAHKEVTWR